MANIFADIMSATIFYQLISCSIVTAVNLFAIYLNGLFRLESFVAFIDIISVLAPTFFYCKLSDCVISDLHEIGDICFNMAWYELPLKQQKLFVPMIQRAQHGVSLTGFGVVACSLPAFLGVSGFLNILSKRIFFHFHAFFDFQIIRSSYSFFLVLLNFK